MASIHFVPNSGGLSDLYQIDNEQPKKYWKFQPKPPINGFPAVLQEVDPNEDQNGMCGYVVGMNDHDAVSFFIQENPGGDPCDDVKQVALSATKTMASGE